eukprot:67981-Amphidinium_carterae.1
MSCKAEAFTFLESLTSSWPMTPASCGAQRRPPPARYEVESCSARWASRQSGTTNHAFSVCTVFGPLAFSPSVVH